MLYIYIVSIKTVFTIEYVRGVVVEQHSPPRSFCFWIFKQYSLSTLQQWRISDLARYKKRLETPVLQYYSYMYHTGIKTSQYINNNNIIYIIGSQPFYIRLPPTKFENVHVSLDQITFFFHQKCWYTLIYMFQCLENTSYDNISILCVQKEN